MITFTIGYTQNSIFATCQAEEGMTWYEWCQSEYNTTGFRCQGENSLIKNSTGLYQISDEIGKYVITEKHYLMTGNGGSED